MIFSPGGRCEQQDPQLANPRELTYLGALKAGPLILARLSWTLIWHQTLVEPFHACVVPFRYRGHESTAGFKNDIREGPNVNTVLHRPFEGSRILGDVDLRLVDE